jgi:serine/threonine protein kinase
MHELINEFRAALQEHLAGQIDVQALERVLVTRVSEEPDVAPTYSALIEARHRAGHLSEGTYLQLIAAVRTVLQAHHRRTAQPRPEETRYRVPPPQRPTNPPAPRYDGTAIRPRPSAAQSASSAVAADDSLVSVAGAASSAPTDVSATAPTDTSRPPSTGPSWGDSRYWSSTPSERLAPGCTVKDRFVLEDVLGRGGMGVVFKARDLRKEEAQDRNPYVAIKILSEEFKRHPQSLKALQREARKAQKLAHPNIVNVFDFDRDDGNVFMAMELLEGESLDRVIKRLDRQGMPQKEALRVVQGLCAALSYAHEQGVIHSDFKPANAYLTREGVVKVLDFGIARANKRRNGLSAAATTLFDPNTLGALTPAYASCEMIEGLEPDPRDDIYAIAVVAYELLTGRHPFNKLSAVQARDAGLSPAPVRGLSQRQRQALRRGLAFKRDQRTPTVAQFINELSPNRKSTLARVSIAAGSAVAIGVAGALALWLLVAFSGSHSTLIDRTVPVLQAIPGSIRSSILTGSARKGVLERFNVRVEQVFDPSHQLYDAPRAQALVAELSSLLPDSQAVATLSRRVEDRQNDALKDLRAHFADVLAKGWLIDRQSPRNASAVLDAVRVMDPGNPLLTDGRLTEAFIRESEHALGTGKVELARALIDAGRKFAPNNAQIDDLAGRLDRLVQEGTTRVASLKTSLRQGLSEPLTLEEVDAQRTALAELVRIAPDDADLKAWQQQLEPLIDPQMEKLVAQGSIVPAGELLEKYAQLLLPSYVDRRRASLQAARATQPPQVIEQPAASLAQIKESIEGLIARPSLDRQWDRQVKEQLARLSAHLPKTDPYVSSERSQVAALYVRAASGAREAQELGRAEWLLGRAQEYDRNSADLQREQQLLLSAHATLEEDRNRQREVVEVEGIKQDLLAQAQASDVPAALGSLETLRTRLTADDPFLKDAQTEIAQAYLDLAENAEREGRVDDARNLTLRAAELGPDSARVKYMLKKYALTRAAVATNAAAQSEGESR